MVRTSTEVRCKLTPGCLVYTIRLSPQAISKGMLRRPPINLNKQAEDATITLIREVIDSGISLSEVSELLLLRAPSSLRYTHFQVYVDALGNTSTYEAYLSKIFPGIQFTVTAKADSKFKIVGAASVAAKVTRDAWITGWLYEENSNSPSYKFPENLGSGYPSGMKLLYGSTVTPG